MSIATIALLAAITALALAAVLAAAVVRSRRASDRRLAQGLREVGGRMDELARELAAAVEKVREDAVRTRLVESFGQELDLDEVLARCTEAAAALGGVTGATAEVEVDGEHLAASTGLGVGAATTVGGPPDGGPVRAVGLSYHYAAAAAGRDPMRSAIAVPIEAEGRRLGFLTVFGREEEPPVQGEDFATLEAIARHAGPALARARARRLPGQAPERDPLTGLGNRQALHEALALEVARAQRLGRSLALGVFDLDEFRRLNEHVGQIAADDVLREVASLLRAEIGQEDTAYRCGGDAFAVIMPGARRIDGEALYARLQGSLGRGDGSRAGGVTLSAGLAELKPDDDGVSLYERANRALRRRGGGEGAGTAA